MPDKTGARKSMPYEFRSSKKESWEAPGAGRSRRRAQSSPQKINSMAEKFMSSFGEVQASPTAILAASWKKVVGKELALETKPAKLDKWGVLHIVASSPGWATKAHWQSQEIMKNANRFLRLGTIKSVKVRALEQDFLKS